MVNRLTTFTIISKFKLVRITLSVTRLLETHILIIKNGQFCGKYIFKTAHFDIQIASINNIVNIQD